MTDKMLETKYPLPEELTSDIIEEVISKSLQSEIPISE